MSYSRTQERGTAPVKSLLLAMLVALVSLFAVGCGDSGEDFVVTGNNGGGGANTGAVTFQFQRAQQTVPTATAFFDIRFFNANGAQVFEALNVPFNTTVTINNVPTSATSAVVTAKNAAGVPLQTINYTIGFNGATGTATPGTATDVTFTALDTTPSNVSVAVGATAATSSSVSFSDGTSLSAAAAGGALSFTSSNAAVATVSAAGVITGVSAGTATVTASYVLNGVTRTDTVTVTVTAPAPPAGTLVVSPTSATLTNTTLSQVFTTTVNGSAVNVTGTLSNFTGGLTATNLTFNNATKTLAVDAAAIFNGTATLTLASGNATATVPVTVSRLASGQTPTPPGTPARLVLNQENLFIAPGGTTQPLSGTFVPANSTVGISVGGATANSFTAIPTTTNPANTATNWSYDSPTNSVRAFNGANVPGDNNSITFRIVYTAPNGQQAEDTINVTATTNAALPTQVQSATVATIRGNSLKLPAGSNYPIIVLEVLGNGMVNPVTPQRGNGDTVANGEYQVTSSSAAVVYVGGSGFLNYAGIGSANLVVTRNNNTVGGVGGTIATIAGTTVDAATVAPTPALNAQLALTGANSGPVNAVIPYKVDLVFTDASRQDITPVAAVGWTGGLTVNQLGGFNTGSVTINAAGPATLFLTGALVTGNITNYNPNTTPVAITGTP